MSKKNLSFVVLGSGNVATHLAKVLNKNNYKIKQVYSKTLLNAEYLAKQINCKATNDVSKIKEADCYLICLKDDSIFEVLNKINVSNKLLIATSGTLPLNVYLNYSRKVAILYPLQTLSKKRSVTFKKVPLLIEASGKQELKQINKIAHNISSYVVEASSEQRLKYHLAAVFANNFTNYLYQIAETICIDNKLDFELLKPLIIETAHKILNMSPVIAQTGPAKRSDLVIMQKHLSLLKKYPSYQFIYKWFSEQISGIQL
jgi:predicted short-subunit dehydrogenase-like oxidoreductase (DUF2520 family)